MEKKIARLRRAKKTRSHIRRMGVPRLTVHRSGRHIYAQVITAEGGSVIAAASTVQKDVRTGLKSTSNKDAAKAVGKAVAEKAVAAGVTNVAFDRSGYRYHGRVAELADGAREGGLQF
ncbi:MAG: 50S ribosomal protein L18 [Gammaproteobacteria bacterium]|jgi:large subunit ribosomal protein L18|nr:50S ribosomal protein L18 [Gammaproteobacteria bacterium]MBT8076349.1 50S ribosomal protein L18 [Gammaproteobacteria bacterium]NNK98184.1 50S ribosomal protein L18 [Xanthomonadales bacterium]